METSEGRLGVGTGEKERANQVRGDEVGDGSRCRRLGTAMAELAGG